jgi:hypothetical protein
MEMRFFLARLVLFGFEASMYFSSQNGESVKIYLDSIFKDTPVAIIEISEDDFTMFSRSGFKFYTIPNLVQPPAQEDRSNEILDDTVEG